MQIQASPVVDSRQISHCQAQSNRETRSKSQTPPKIKYKGITLKEYFRLCQQNTIGHQIDEIEGQSQSSDGDVAQTPTFGVNQDTTLPKKQRNKIKTEIDEEDEIDILEKLTNTSKFNKSLTNQKLSHQIELKPLIQGPSQYNGRSPQYDRKKIYSIPPKSNKDFLNRSTLSSFCNIQKNKKKMLNKLKTQKDRIDEMKLSDAFSITKYASRFKIDEKLIK